MPRTRIVAAIVMLITASSPSGAELPGGEGLPVSTWVEQTFIDLRPEPDRIQFVVVELVNRPAIGDFDAVIVFQNDHIVGDTMTSTQVYVWTLSPSHYRFDPMNWRAEINVDQMAADRRTRTLRKGQFDWEEVSEIWDGVSLSFALQWDASKSIATETSVRYPFCFFYWVPLIFPCPPGGISRPAAWSGVITVDGDSFGTFSNMTGAEIGWGAG